MTRARRRVVRLALMVNVACIEPVFVGCSSYSEIQARLELQLAGLTCSRRKAVRRQALRLISAAGGLVNAGDHLVPHPPQRGSIEREPPVQSSLLQASQRPPEIPRCSACRMRGGLGKRIFKSQAAAQRIWNMQKDPGLVVYACVANSGFHLGHPSKRSSTVAHPAPISQRCESNYNEAPMLPAPQHKTSPTMQATLGHPVLIFIYSTALLLIGCSVGRHWIHTPVLWCSLVGAALVVAHDLATGFLFFSLSARWTRSVLTQRK
jgi:hypothetical protein